jgi:hypothetical protein
MQVENARTHPGLKIVKVRWLDQIIQRDFAPLVVEVDTAEQANRLISQGLTLAFDLKIVERYDSKCRIIQCFKCQRYGHISTRCQSAQKCGHCGGGHTTNECAEGSQAKRRCCAACDGGQHASWSTACQSRVREGQRARTARRIMIRLYPVSVRAPTPIFNDSPAGSMRFTSSTQSSEGWTDVTLIKKRKFGTPGRSVRAVNKAKIIERDTDTRTFNFVSQIIMQKFGESPASTQLSTDTEMDAESIVVGSYDSQGFAWPCLAFFMSSNSVMRHGRERAPLAMTRMLLEPLLRLAPRDP